MFSLVGVGAGSLAHALGGGIFPSLAGFVPPVVLTTLVSLLLLWRKTAVGVFASVFVGQWIFHHTVSWAAGPVSHSHHHVVNAVPLVDDSVTVMGFAHILAAVVTGVAVMSADRAITSLVAAVALIWHRVSDLFISRDVAVIFRPSRLRDGGWLVSETVAWTQTSPSAPRGPPLLSFS